MRHGFVGVQRAPVSHRVLPSGKETLPALPGHAPGDQRRLRASPPDRRATPGREPYVIPVRLRQTVYLRHPGHRYRRGDLSYDFRRLAGRNDCRNVDQPGQLTLGETRYSRRIRFLSAVISACGQDTRDIAPITGRHETTTLVSSAGAMHRPMIAPHSVLVVAAANLF